MQETSTKLCMGLRCGAVELLKLTKKWSSHLHSVRSALSPFFHTVFSVYQAHAGYAGRHSVQTWRVCVLGWLFPVYVWPVAHLRYTCMVAGAK